MQVTELREMGDEQLVERLDDAKEELFNLRFQNATGQLDNPSRIKQVRHDVARILTVLSERTTASERRSPEKSERRSPEKEDES
ncbi:MAG: 50S ribosomal protein L29 [Actinomycetota bacterium]